MAEGAPYFPMINAVAPEGTLPGRFRSRSRQTPKNTVSWYYRGLAITIRLRGYLPVLQPACQKDQTNGRE